MMVIIKEVRYLERISSAEILASSILSFSSSITSFKVSSLCLVKSSTKLSSNVIRTSKTSWAPNSSTFTRMILLVLLLV